MRRSCRLAAARDRPRVYVFLLTKGGTYQSGVAFDPCVAPHTLNREFRGAGLSLSS